MKKKIILLCFAISALLCACSSIDRSTPEATITGYYEAIMARDFEKIPKYSPRLNAESLTEDNVPILEEYKIKRIIPNDDGVSAKARVLQRYNKDSKLGTKTLWLEKKDGEWFIK